VQIELFLADKVKLRKNDVVVLFFGSNDIFDVAQNLLFAAQKRAILSGVNPNTANPSKLQALQASIFSQVSVEARKTGQEIGSTFRGAIAKIQTACETGVLEIKGLDANARVADGLQFRIFTLPTSVYPPGNFFANATRFPDPNLKVWQLWLRQTSKFVMMCSRYNLQSPL